MNNEKPDRCVFVCLLMSFMYLYVLAGVYVLFSMYVCLYVCMYVFFLFVCMLVCIYVCMYVCACVRIVLDLYIYTHRCKKAYNTRIPS